ncbi:hypothetical protein GCM10023231_18640 [Olivibacter ginsenosidimutans]|uniref:Thioredoxin domain-containing protein n=1 Tax=Olivibacter ginsenosidimutans TaxID=1176537 RepID=A0ABP9B5M5_9SPHI
MKALSMIWPMATLIFVSCFSREASDDKTTDKAQQARPVVISVSLKPGEELKLMVPAKYNGKFHFKNSSRKDTVITERVVLDKPLFLDYNNIYVLQQGTLSRTYSLLLSPGDSIILKKEEGALSLSYASGFPNFIDSLITLSQDQNLKAMDLSETIQQIEASFKQNEVAIRNLHLPETRKDLLTKLNSKNKYALTAHLLADSAMTVTKTTDSLYDDLYEHADDIRSIDALHNQWIFGTLIAYNAKKQNKNIDKRDVWACIVGADQQLKQRDFYKEYVANCVAWSFMSTPKDIEAIKRKLQSVHTQDPYLDTIYQLTSILSGTFTDFKQAKKKLTTFAGGRYRYLIESDEASANHEMKSIANLPPVDLYDFTGKQTDFKRTVTDKNQPLTVIDFWASWCIPCIAEIPHLKKIERAFKNKPIQFVTISIDKEADIAKWIAVAKKNGIYNSPHQYRLANFKESALTKLLNIRNIPRYIVMNNKGDILDDDFYRPSNGNFELELLKYME